MTEAAKQAASSETYSVIEYKRSGKFVCWCTKIGYAKNAKGERVRAWQYHGKDYATAQAAALRLGQEWGEIVAEYKKRRAYHIVWSNAALPAL